eukprot:3207167-Prorocentrum_lima.AAC.1
MQYHLPTASTAPQVFTPNTAAASTWPGSSPPSHAPVSDNSSYDIIMQGTGTSVSQLPTTEALPRLEMGAPGLVPAGLIPQPTSAPAAS